MEKYCPKCKETKPLTEFYQRKNYRWESEKHQGYCKSCVSVRTKEHYQKNKSKYQKKESDRRKKLGNVLLEQRREARRKYRENVIKQYGGECVCCGETEFKFLAIDHIKGGGRKHLKEIGGASSLIYWLKKNGYPKGFQILCYNCNMAKGLYGKCPHIKL